MKLNGKEKGQYFFTADEHYGHDKPFIYQARGFPSVEEMDETLIANHNEVVSDRDTVIHGGDFSLYSKTREDVHKKYVMRLNGNHIFVKGSHDYWLRGWHDPQILEIKMKKAHIVICHYCMRTWPRSHYNSWHLFGHSHGRLEPIGKRWDITVDNNNFYPLAFWEIRNIMKKRPDNPNLVKK